MRGWEPLPRLVAAGALAGGDAGVVAIGAGAKHSACATRAGAVLVWGQACLPVPARARSRSRSEGRSRSRSRSRSEERSRSDASGLSSPPPPPPPPPPLWLLQRYTLVPTPVPLAAMLRDLQPPPPPPPLLQQQGQQQQQQQQHRPPDDYQPLPPAAPLQQAQRQLLQQAQQQGQGVNGPLLRELQLQPLAAPLQWWPLRPGPAAPLPLLPPPAAAAAATTGAAPSGHCATEPDVEWPELPPVVVRELSCGDGWTQVMLALPPGLTAAVVAPGPGALQQ